MKLRISYMLEEGDKDEPFTIVLPDGSLHEFGPTNGHVIVDASQLALESASKEDKE